MYTLKYIGTIIISSTLLTLIKYKSYTLKPIPQIINKPINRVGEIPIPK